MATEGRIQLISPHQQSKVDSKVTKKKRTSADVEIKSVDVLFPL